MKIKGFTLVEMLTVIIILGIIFAISFPVVNSIINYSEDKIYNSQINTILDAAYNYTLKYPNYLPSTGSNTVTLLQLKQENLVDSNLTNPKNNELFSDTLQIVITKYNNEELNQFQRREGDYLYTVVVNN